MSKPVKLPRCGPVPDELKTFANLPDDAKEACRKFVRAIPGFTREQYVRKYEWSRSDFHKNRNDY